MFKQIKLLAYAITPLAILFSLILFACVLGYAILKVCGDFWPLHKIISRISQLLLVLSIFPLRRRLNLSWSELGFAPYPKFFQQLIHGLGLGLMTLLPMLLILYALEVHQLDLNRNWTLVLILKKTLISFALAILISCVEEPLFRGILFSGLRLKIGLKSAIILSSIYYGSLHFLETNTSIDYQTMSLNSSFELLSLAISNWLNPHIFSAFIALMMVGLFLAVIRSQIPQSLGLCIGFHASWVWQIKLHHALFNNNPHSSYTYLVSSYDGLIGPLTTVWLIISLGIYWYSQKIIIKS